MISLTKHQLTKIIQGETIGNDNRLFTGVEFDSRQVNNSCLFIALPGKTTHGHQFLSEVFDKGASLALVEDRSLLLSHEHRSQLIYVSSSLKAFFDLAHWWRLQLSVPVIAITGSVGKTTVKEIVRHILDKTVGTGTYSLKSYNNHTGVPYSLCRVDEGDKWVVLELGMNNFGEISSLSKLVNPTVGCITGIHPVHLSQFRDMNEIAAAKFELLDGIQPGSALVLNGDDPYTISIIKDRSLNKKYAIKFFGRTESADLHVTSIVSNGLKGISFQLISATDNVSVNVPIVGTHNATNAACAAQIVSCAFPMISLGDIGKALSTFQLPNMRLTIHPWRTGSIVDDSYNASPTSVKGMLSLAKEMISQGNKVGLVLGDMLELGKKESDYHQTIAEEIVDIHPCFVVSVGQLAKIFHTTATIHGIDSVIATDPLQAASEVEKRSADIIFVKGSRKIGLDQTVKQLLQS